jgi:hypothetical protein
VADITKRKGADGRTYYEVTNIGPRSKKKGTLGIISGQKAKRLKRGVVPKKKPGLPVLAGRG